MSSLSSSSPIADAVAQYKDNLAHWESDTKAKNLLEACYYLLEADSRRRSDAGLSIEKYDLQKLIDTLEVKAKKWSEEAVSDATTLSRRSFTVGRPI